MFLRDHQAEISTPEHHAGEDVGSMLSKQTRESEVVALCDTTSLL